MKKITVIGLGYVGLPLAVEFAKKYPVVGFDINQKRVDELNSGHDATLEVEDKDLNKTLVRNNPGSGKGLYLTTKLDEIKDSKIYIVTVPTPIDEYKRPDLTPLIKASETLGKVVKKGDIVIYESTVYPGATEEDCIPIIEKISGLKFNVDFYAGYSPERINPGDKVHTVTHIKKVTSGSTPEIAEEVDQLYKSIIVAGTHKASSIKVAEAAKVIENSQRDINIAFVNELSVIFNKLNIDTLEVLEAAGTKWNFLPFRPGLVGGHCIGIDPYYLTHKAQSVGYNPEIILAGRRLNDSMGFRVAGDVVKLMIKKNHRISETKVLVMGITFKENCPDIRNSRVIDVIEELKSYGCCVDVYDPWADAEEVKEEYNVDLIDNVESKTYDAVVLAVSHNEFKEMDVTALKNKSGVIFDIKAIIDKSLVDGRL
jgi:UDP-N-acetyl-D-glucosamine/UDP-N-acetyl-D-galactosamine dehydrogenase